MEEIEPYGATKQEMTDRIKGNRGQKIIKISQVKVMLKIIFCNFFYIEGIA